ncbi:MAG: hypothetical protein ABFR35_02590 [Thermodesulfobacteriota bacterium]
MSGRQVFRKNKAVHLITLFLLLLFAGQLVSCAAGTGVTPEVLVEPAPAPVSIDKAGDDAKVLDVTTYYSRPENNNPRRGRGLAIFETENFIGSSRCAVCHELLVDSTGNDMSIPGHWRSTMMANAAKDPLWLAKVSSEVKRNPGLKKVIEEKCATCHMPMAWTQAYKQEGERVIFDNGLLSPQNDLHGAAMDGVSCSLCHQVQDENLGRKESFSGKFVIDTGGKAPEREIFGPYKDPVQKTMQQSVGYTPVFGSQMNDSALCAACHTLYTPFVDGQGNVAGEFPEQTPYLEWKYSDFGVNAENRYDIGENPGQGMICQECHMPHSEAGDVSIANWAPPEAEPKDHFSQHHFVGGNVFMLNILQDNIGSLKISASTDGIEDTKERTMHQLQTETASLSVVGLKHRGNEITAELKVNNKVGHKFPSGIPTRRSWIHLMVADVSGQMVFESGKPLVDGSIEGNDADRDSMSYEEHYDEITRPDQVQIYEGIMLNTDNAVTFTLMRAAKYAKDNRLLPNGFDKTAVPADIGVFGRALSDDDFTGGSDQVTYRIDTSGHRGPFTMTARLLFTPVSYSFVKDLAKDDDLPEVNRFMFLYRKADKMGQEVAAIRTTIK